MFTASHNPAQYNGIKLCRPGAAPVGQDSGLREITLGNIINWAWLDYMLRMEHDVILETGKIRRAGFHECLETGEIFVQRLTELQVHRVL
jgi:phosphomannomutase